MGNNQRKKLEAEKHNKEYNKPRTPRKIVVSGAGRAKLAMLKALSECFK